MTDQDRAFRALSLKIVGELWPMATRWFAVKATLEQGTFRSAAQTFTAEVEQCLNRYVPRLPETMPPYEDFRRAFDDLPDVLRDPAEFESYDPKIDPILVLRSVIVRHKLPVHVRPGSVFMIIADHYRPLTMKVHA